MANIIKSFVLNQKKLAIRYHEYDTHEVPRQIESGGKQYDNVESFKQGIAGWLDDLLLGDTRIDPTANQHKWDYRFYQCFVGALIDYAQANSEEVPQDRLDKAFDYVIDNDKDELDKLLHGILHGFPSEPKDARRKRFYVRINNENKDTAHPDIVAKHVHGKIYYGDYQQSGMDELAKGNFYRAKSLATSNPDKYSVVTKDDLPSPENI